LGFFWTFLRFFAAKIVSLGPYFFYPLSCSFIIREIVILYGFLSKEQHKGRQNNIKGQKASFLLMPLSPIILITACFLKRFLINNSPKSSLFVKMQIGGLI
jgi:hypothetical protein